MKQFLLTFLGSFSGIITAFIVLNFLKGFRNLIFSDKALDYKVFKNFLEKDFNKIKINDFDNFVINLDNEIKNNNETINFDRNKKLAENLIYLKAILTDEEKIVARDEIVSKYDFRNRGYFFIKLIDENFERIVKYKNEKLNN